jgi:hypothetical protein
MNIKQRLITHNGFNSIEELVSSVNRKRKTSVLFSIPTYLNPNNNKASEALLELLKDIKTAGVEVSVSENEVRLERKKK